MSYSNVVGGKLKLKGKALDVRAGGMKKKKKKRDTQEQLRLLTGREESERQEVVNSPTRSLEANHPVSQQAEDRNGEGQEEEEEQEKEDEGRERQPEVEDHRTPAEKKYHEQKAKLEAQRLSKVASKSHRQRVEEFNQYLANLSEHYDIPKVGPG